MSNATLETTEVTFDNVLRLAEKLRPVDQARLVARLAPKVEQIVEQKDANVPARIGIPLWGLCADLKPVPSAEEIDEVRREMWANFAKE